MEVQPVRDAVAMMAATAVLLKNFISDLNTCLVEAFPKLPIAAFAATLLPISLWLFRGRADADVPAAPV
tara:strand:- start:3256 stop:3462 length:207 start_codon:yes stop_codon:yes gene_type:complete